MIADNIGGFVDVPMLASNTGNEASGLPHTAFLDVYRAYLNITFGSLAEEAPELYPANNDEEARSTNWSTWTAARLQARPLKSKVWYARFHRSQLVQI